MVSLAYSIPVELASVCVSMCVSLSTLSKVNISETSGPITTKFYLKHCWGGEKGCIRFKASSDWNTGFHGNGWLT